MDKTVNLDYLENDYGFSFVNDPSVEKVSVEQVLEEVKEENKILRKRMIQAQDLIIPFLKRFLDAKADYIHWPSDKREKAVKDQIEAIERALKV